jgi:hypothetical protein
MLQDMDNMEGSFVFYVKVGTFTHPEQSENTFMTVNETGMVSLTVRHDSISSVRLMLYSRHSLRQISTDVLSLVQ